MSLLYPHARLLIFAKAPLPGRAKTRLIPLLGAQGAADLHARLLRSTIEMACAADIAAVELWLAGDWESSQLEALTHSYPIICRRQHGADLGQRMSHAASRGTTPAVIIGSDCPVMNRDVLGRAFASLQSHPVVFQPAEDGGYTLVGLRRPVPQLFQGIDWGGPRVLEQSLQRAREMRADVKLLEMSWDLDRPEDYRRAMDGSLLPPAEA